MSTCQPGSGYDLLGFQPLDMTDGAAVTAAQQLAGQYGLTLPEVYPCLAGESTTSYLGALGQNALDELLYTGSFNTVDPGLQSANAPPVSATETADRSSLLSGFSLAGLSIAKVALILVVLFFAFKFLR